MFIKRFLLLISGLLGMQVLCAQLCQGSLGDPVVNITFGSGQNFGAPLNSTLTNYQFVRNTCPDDGFYTIANSTLNCFGGTWHSVQEDHTPGDINGYMMVVNASFNPGVFYLDTVKGLCGGTTYEFAAWLLNVLGPSACIGTPGNGIKPNITFNIETTAGDILQTNSTGDIMSGNTPSWKQYGVFFSTPPNTSSVVIRMTNNAPGGCGNDILLDDITFRPCGPKVSINVNRPSNDISVCVGDTSGFTFTSNIVAGYINTFYQWQESTDSTTWTDIPGANKPQYSIPAIVNPGKYFYRVAVAEGNNISVSSCRIASDFATITVNPLPVPKASNGGNACEGKDMVLSAGGGGTYLWTGPANFTSNEQSPVIKNLLVANSGVYHVIVTSESGCINTDSTVVVVNRNPVANAGSSVEICEGASTTLHGSIILANSFTWSPAAGLSDVTSLSPAASPLETTLYTLTVSDGTCENSDTVLVTVLQQPSANAGPDKVFIEGQAVTLNGEASGGDISYYWTPDLYISSVSVLDPDVSPPYDTTYILHVISNGGCGIASDSVHVRYFKEIYIPNAFTPNNDGRNDKWNIPVLTAFPLAEVSIYNRYGQLVFYNKGNTKQWDGSFKGLPQSSGVYCYIVDLKNGFKKLSGIVILIR